MNQKQLDSSPMTFTSFLRLKPKTPEPHLNEGGISLSIDGTQLHLIDFQATATLEVLQKCKTGSKAWLYCSEHPKK